MAHLTQSRLGGSSQRTLCNLPTLLRKTFEICFISKLPNEVLVEILRYLPKAKPILHVCRLWRDVYEPIFYRNLTFVCMEQQEKTSVDNLVRTLEQRSDLSNYVRVLDLVLCKPRAALVRLLVKLIGLCKLMTTLEYCSDRSTFMWRIIVAAANLHHLKRLKFKSRVMNLGDYTALVHTPTQQIIGMPQAGLWRGSVTQTFPHSPRNIFTIGPFNSTIIDLEIKDPRVDPSCTRILLEWPANLASITIESLVHSRYSVQYTVDAVEQLLRSQRNSLKYIKLGVIPGLGAGIPNLSSFQCLQYLELSAKNLLVEEAWDASVKLNAPRLRHLKIDFAPKCCCAQTFNRFSRQQACWIKQFAFSIASRTGTICMLENIFVDFILSKSGPHSTYDEAVWPWEYLNQAALAISGCGIVMTYSEPVCTEEQWYATKRYLS